MTVMAAGQRMVVVVAHPDDETFQCGSLIAAAARAGGHVTVLCATVGEAGERLPDPATDGLPLAVVRERELRAAAAALGAERVELLGFADSGFDGPLPDGALCGVAIEALVALLAVWCDELRPDVIVALDGGDGHRDHLHIRAAVEAFAVTAEQPVELVLSCLTNSLMRRWVAEMVALDDHSPYVHIDLAAIGTPDEQVTDRLDATDVYDVRRGAIALHASQHSPYDRLSPELHRAFLCTDHVIRVSPVR